MEIRVLRYFIAVAREETISKASEVIHVTQPTLSRQLMELEEELGKRLFIRGNRKITLTSEGMFFLKRAQEIVELVDKTEADFNTSDESIGGDVYIGGGETDTMRIIAKTVKKLRRDYPNICYHIFSGNADDVTERLDKGLLDFGILIEPANIKKYDYIRLPAVDTWGILMRKDSHLSKLEYIKPENLRDIPLLCSRQRLVSNSMSEWLGGNYERLNIVTTYNLIYNAALMVEEGVGYALCIDKLVNTTGNSNLCFKPLEPPLRVNLDMVWKKYQVFSKAAEKFLERIQEEISYNNNNY